MEVFKALRHASVEFVHWAFQEYTARLTSGNAQGLVLHIDSIIRQCVAPKIKAEKLPAKWRTAQELYAEEQLSWNLSQTVVNSNKRQSSTRGEMYRAILEDVIADWKSGKISDEKKQPFEEKETGTITLTVVGMPGALPKISAYCGCHEAA